MIKTHPKSRIVQFHHTSQFANDLIGMKGNNGIVVLQIEAVPHSDYDFIAEIIDRQDYEEETQR